MRLYKAWSMHGDYASSVWPASSVVPTPMTEAAAGPWSSIWVSLRAMGWTDAQINTWVTVLFNHYIRDLGYTAPGAWLVMSSIVLEWKASVAAGVAMGWFWAGIALGVGLIVYALIAPVHIPDLIYPFGPKQYLMLYQDKVWFAELIGVSLAQKPVYQKGTEVDIGMMLHQREIEGMDWNYDEFWYSYAWEEKKWEWGLFKRVRWKNIRCTYVANLVKVGVNHYEPKGFQKDRFLDETGPWTSPGGMWGMPGYTGLIYPGYFA